MAYNNNGNGFAYISRNNSENEKAPYFRGFVKLSPELLEYIAEAETDAEGNVMLDMSLWKKDGGASGSVTIPYKAKQQRQAPKAAPTKKAQSTKPSKFQTEEDDNF